jgi:hypothetical protein
MRFPATMKWVSLALLGLLIAGGVAYAASGLISQQIGIGSESISAGDALAPAMGDSEKGVHTQSGRGEESTSPPVDEGSPGTPTTPASQLPSPVPVEPSEPGDDHSGDGSHGGEGADD